MPTREQKIQVADTIISQLGGREFLMMTGVKNKALLSGDDLGVALFVGEGAHNEVATVIVKLDPSDTYTLATRDTQEQDVSRAEGLHWDQLQDVFADHTGFYCTMQHPNVHQISLADRGEGLAHEDLPPTESSFSRPANEPSM